MAIKGVPKKCPCCSEKGVRRFRVVSITVSYQFECMDEKCGYTGFYEPTVSEEGFVILREEIKSYE